MCKVYLRTRKRYLIGVREFIISIEILRMSFLCWKPTIQKVRVSGHTPAASSGPERLIYLTIRLVYIIHSTLLSVNDNKNSVLKMYYHFFAFV